MLRVKKRRWLPAAAVLPLILAACTSTTGRQGPGTGTTGTVAGSGSAGPGGLRAVRHVRVIELENEGYDGHDAPCVTGAPGGLAQADAFLSQWVPTIMAAPAYRDGGLIVITFDEGSDSAACCGETSGISPSHPNVPLPGKTGPGGGRTGAVLLSPLIRPGTVSTVAYNHYSLLRSIEDIFGQPHLGDAAMPQVRSFGPDVFG